MPRPKTPSLVDWKASSRRRWNKADAGAALERLKRSGLSMREFARGEGLNVQRLYWWRRALRRPAAESGPAFLEVVATGPTAQLEVVLRSGLVVRVPAGFCEETVRRLVTALDGSSVRC
jgi:transposase-like protein